MKTTLLILFTLLCMSLFGTILNEGFEGAVFPPAAWTTTTQYTALNSNPTMSHSGSNSALISSISVASMLITPRLRPTPANHHLIYYYSMYPSPGFMAGIQVKLSTGTNNIADFTTTLETIVVSVNSGYVQRTLDLTAYINQNIYLGFTEDFILGLTYVDDVSGIPIYVGMPSYPNPADEAHCISQAATPDLEWVNPPDAVKNRIYFSTSLSAVTNKEESALVLDGLATGTLYNAYDYAGTLSGHTTYYWRVVESDGFYTGDGPVLCFTTTVPAPSSPVPANNAINVSRNASPDISWTLSSAPMQSTDVYFSTSQEDVTSMNPSARVLNGIATNTSHIHYDAPDSLAPYTTYFWRVAIWDYESPVVGPVWSFSTRSDPVTTFPYSMDFDTFYGWNTQHLSGDGAEITRVTESTHPTATPRSPQNMVKFNAHSNQLYSMMRLISIPLALPVSEQPTSLIFYIYKFNSFYWEPLFVQVSPDFGGTWTIIGEVVSTECGADEPPGWYRITRDISSFQGQEILVGLVFQNIGLNNFYIDDFKVTPFPVPDQPVLISPQNGFPLNPIHGNLQWNLGNNTPFYDLWFGRADSTMIRVLTDQPAPEPGEAILWQYSSLSYGATYCWKVVPKNNEDEDPGPIWRLTTIHNPVNIPYDQDFNESQELPEGWIRGSNGDHWQVVPSGIGTGNTLCFQFSNYTPNMTHEVIMVPMQEFSGEYCLAFTHTVIDGGSALGVIAVQSSIDGLNWVPHWSLEPWVVLGQQTESIVIPHWGTDYTLISFIFSGHCSENFSWQIDDVVIQSNLSNHSIDNLSIKPINGGLAFSWDPLPYTACYKIYKAGEANAGWPEGWEVVGIVEAPETTWFIIPEPGEERSYFRVTASDD